jgi:hypothetical protein
LKDGKNPCQSLVMTQQRLRAYLRVKHVAWDYEGLLVPTSVWLGPEKRKRENEKTTVQRGTASLLRDWLILAQNVRLPVVVPPITSSAMWWSQSWKDFSGDPPAMIGLSPGIVILFRDQNS